MNIFFKIFLLIFLILKTSNSFSEENKIKIGILAPLSGENAGLGQQIVNSIRMALIEIDDNKIEVYPKDTKSDPNIALQSAKDLDINLSKDVTENVVLWDERLSSQGAFNLSNDLASNTTKKVSKLDQNSAQFILQGVLDYLTK